MDQTNQTNTKNKMNWKVVMIGVLIVFILYFSITFLQYKGVLKQRETHYCYFNVEYNESVLPRNECGIIKVVSYDVDKIDLEKFVNLDVTTQCSKKLSDLPTCEGEVYNFFRDPLHNYCDFALCDVDGVVCAAYTITYHSNYSNWRKVYEEDFFTNANITQEEMNNLLKECDVNG